MLSPYSCFLLDVSVFLLWVCLLSFTECTPYSKLQPRLCARKQCSSHSTPELPQKEGPLTQETAYSRLLMQLPKVLHMGADLLTAWLGVGSVLGSTVYGKTAHCLRGVFAEPNSKFRTLFCFVLICWFFGFLRQNLTKSTCLCLLSPEC